MIIFMILHLPTTRKRTSQYSNYERNNTTLDPLVSAMSAKRKDNGDRVKWGRKERDSKTWRQLFNEVCYNLNRSANLNTFTPLHFPTPAFSTPTISSCAEGAGYKQARLVLLSAFCTLPTGRVFFYQQELSRTRQGQDGCSYSEATKCLKDHDNWMVTVWKQGMEIVCLRNWLVLKASQSMTA